MGGDGTLLEQTKSCSGATHGRRLVIRRAAPHLRALLGLLGEVKEGLLGHPLEAGGDVHMPLVEGAFARLDALTAEGLNEDHPDFQRLAQEKENLQMLINRVGCEVA